MEGFEGVVVGGMEGVPVRLDGRRDGVAVAILVRWVASVVVKVVLEVVLCLAKYVYLDGRR